MKQNSICLFEINFRNSEKICRSIFICLFDEISKIKMNSRKFYRSTWNKTAQKHLIVIKLMIGLVLVLVLILIFTCSIFNFHLTKSSNRIRYAQDNKHDERGIKSNVLQVFERVSNMKKNPLRKRKSMFFFRSHIQKALEKEKRF